MDRPHGIGGSDAAAACGVHPYVTPVRLWMEKTGKIDPPDYSEAMRWGNILEPLLLGELGHECGVEITPNATPVIPDPGVFDVPIFATPDGSIGPIGDGGIAEVKTGGLWQASAWQDGATPIQYEVQVRHNMIVTGRSFALIGVLIGGQRFETRRIEHDADLADIIIEKEREFWGYVERDEQPPAEWANADDLKRLYPESKGEVCDLSDAPELVTNLRIARNAAKFAADEADKAELAIKQRMGECESAFVNGTKVVSWASHIRKSVDSSRLKEEYPDLYAELVKPTSVRPFKVLA